MIFSFLICFLHACRVFRANPLLTPRAVSLCSTASTWRAGMLAVRRRCPTPGEQAARSVWTSCSSTAVPTMGAARCPWPHPTWVAATQTSTTTTLSASWTAALASCRRQWDTRNPETSSSSSSSPPSCASHCNPTLVPGERLPERRIHRGHLIFRLCTPIILCFACLLGSFILVLTWSKSTFFYLFILILSTRQLAYFSVRIVHPAKSISFIHTLVLCLPLLVHATKQFSDKRELPTNDRAWL